MNLRLHRGGGVLIDTQVRAARHDVVIIDVLRDRAVVGELHEEVHDPLQPAGLLLLLGHEGPRSDEGVRHDESL